MSNNYGIVAETELEQKVLSDERILKGFEWGEPRPSHPEGKVGAHVKMMLDYIDTQRWNDWRQDLRIITLVHDSFKYVHEPNKKDHAEKAADYYRELMPDDNRVYDIIFHHDTGWKLYKMEKEEGQFNEDKFRKVFETLDLDLLIRFNYADRCNKEKDTAMWFEHKVKNIVLNNAPLIYARGIYIYQTLNE